METNGLDNLKDIHLPSKISIFPLAIGWYILIILLLLILGLVIYWQIHCFKRRQKIKNILNLLNRIEKQSNLQISQNKSEEVITEVSILLKRVAIDKFKLQNPHSLFGEEWLIFLDNTGKTKAFTQGEGQHLRNIYQKCRLTNPELFFSVIRDWLKVVL